MSHVTHMNKLCRTYEWVMSHRRISHVTHTNKSCHTCRTYERVMSHTWMSHVTQANQSCHTYEWVMSHMSHIWIYHVAHVNHPTQSIMYVPLQVNRFQTSILRIVQYKYWKSCSGDFILQNLILRTRSCVTGFITQSGWVFHFHKTTLVFWKWFVP